VTSPSDSSSDSSDEESVSRPDENGNAVRVFFSNAPFSFRLGQVRAAFSQFGHVAHVFLIRDKRADTSLGKGFVTFADSAGYQACMAAGGLIMGGRPVTVAPYRKRS
jgi:RNA recognition motif-containing protein